jgi:hypothetical protein
MPHACGCAQGLGRLAFVLRHYSHSQFSVVCSLPSLWCLPCSPVFSLNLQDGGGMFDWQRGGLQHLQLPFSCWAGLGRRFLCWCERWMAVAGSGSCRSGFSAAATTFVTIAGGAAGAAGTLALLARTLPHLLPAHLHAHTAATRETPRALPPGVTHFPHY